MKPIEVAAYNRGAQTILDLAASAAQAIRTVPGFRSTWDGFAVEALPALSEEGRALLLCDPGDEAVAELRTPDKLINGGTGAAVLPVVAE